MNASMRLNVSALHTTCVGLDDVVVSALKAKATTRPAEQDGLLKGRARTLDIGSG
jgi:hypothetical protein